MNTLSCQRPVAFRWALAKALAQSTGDLQKSGPVSESVRDAVSLLRGVLQGERREEIAAELEQQQVKLRTSICNMPVYFVCFC